MGARPSFLLAGLVAAVAFPSAAFASGIAVSAATGERVDLLHNTIASFSAEGSSIVEQVVWGGDGSEMLWVLALPPAAEVASSSDALVSVFDHQLSVVVRMPPNECFTAQSDCFGGTSVGGGGSGGGPVLPVAGPVLRPSTQTQAASEAEVATWFAELGVTPAAGVMESVEAAELEGYGFLLMELPPGSGLLTSAPLRITASGASPESVPMLSPRGDAEINLTVIGNRRYSAVDQAVVFIEEKDLEWSWDAMNSSYEQLASEAIAAGWLAEAGEPLSPYVFDPLIALANNEPLASGYDPAADAATAVQDDVDALRLGLSSGSTWVTRLSTRVPAGGFPVTLALAPLDSLQVLDRDLTPATETGTIPSCDGERGGCDDFLDEGMGEKDDDFGDCAASARPAGRGWLVLLTAALGLASRRRRLLER